MTASVFRIDVNNTTQWFDNPLSAYYVPSAQIQCQYWILWCLFVDSVGVGWFAWKIKKRFYCFHPLGCGATEVESDLGVLLMSMRGDESLVSLKLIKIPFGELIGINMLISMSKCWISNRPPLMSTTLPSRRISHPRPQHFSLAVKQPKQNHKLIPAQAPEQSVKNRLRQQNDKHSIRLN